MTDRPTDRLAGALTGCKYETTHHLNTREKDTRPRSSNRFALHTPRARHRDTPHLFRPTLPSQASASFIKAAEAALGKDYLVVMVVMVIGMVVIVMVMMPSLNHTPLLHRVMLPATQVFIHVHIHTYNLLQSPLYHAMTPGART